MESLVESPEQDSTGISGSSPPLSLSGILFLPLLSLSGKLYFFPSSLSLVSLFLPLLSLSGNTLPLLSLSGISISSHFHDATVESDDDDEPLLDGGDSHDLPLPQGPVLLCQERTSPCSPFSLASSLVNV